MASCLSSMRGQEEAFLCGPLWGMSGELDWRVLWAGFIHRWLGHELCYFSIPFCFSE